MTSKIQITQVGSYNTYVTVSYLGQPGDFARTQTNGKKNLMGKKKISIFKPNKFDENERDSQALIPVFPVSWLSYNYTTILVVKYKSHYKLS